MNDVYCAYCKRHQDAMNTLQNAQQTRPEVVGFLQVKNDITSVGSTQIYLFIPIKKIVM